ncbi:MAG: metallophosphoesterase [Archangium sp.]
MNARALSFAATLAAVVTVVGIEHLFLWERLVRDTGLPASFAVVLAVFGASIPLAVVSSRVVAPRFARWWVTPAFLWLGVSVLLSFSLLALGLFLDGRTLAASALGLATVLSLWAGVEGRRVRVKRIELQLARLPRELDGLRLVQLSDVHLGPTNGRAFLERVVDTVNRLSPDAVVLTGDLVDAPVSRLTDEVAPLARLSSTFGSFFVTGNHEYHAGPAAWCAHLSSLGIRVLRNERVTLQRGGASLDLAGTDDSDVAGQVEGFHEDLPRALAGRDARRPLVLLAHQPKSVLEAAQLGVDLQLSGHTHGGQLWPMGWLLRASQPAVAGLRHFGETLLYVSRGTGHSGPPMRLASPAEITEVILKVRS